MLDALCLLGLVAFFTFLIYVTVLRAPQASSPPPPKGPPPSPVGLSCSLCRATAGMVSYEEYMRIVDTGKQVYCDWCLTSIEAYKNQKVWRR
jgi:hypothetical protein